MKKQIYTAFCVQANRGGAIFADSNALLALQSVISSGNNADTSKSDFVGCSDCRQSIDGGSVTPLDNADALGMAPLSLPPLIRPPTSLAAHATYIHFLNLQSVTRTFIRMCACLSAWEGLKRFKTHVNVSLRPNLVSWA